MARNCPWSARNLKVETPKWVHRHCDFAPKSWIGLWCRLEVRFWEAASSRAWGASFRFRLLPSGRQSFPYSACGRVARTSRPSITHPGIDEDIQQARRIPFARILTDPVMRAGHLLETFADLVDFSRLIVHLAANGA